MDLIQHATQMREQCLRLESSVMTVQKLGQNNEQLFPVNVGMRPSTSFCSSTSSNSGSMDLLSCPHLHPSPPSSHGHPSSPPSSPVPHLDLRFPETPRKVVSTPHSSPAPNRSTPMTSESPLRHISTLEGRKMRAHTSISADSSFLESSAHHATNPCQNFKQFIAHSLEEVGHGPGHDVSTGHGLANSQVFGADIELNQHFLTCTPCSARARGRTGEVWPSTAVKPGPTHTAPIPSPACHAATCDTLPDVCDIFSPLPATAAPFLATRPENSVPDTDSLGADHKATAPSLDLNTHSVSPSVTVNPASMDCELDEQNCQVLRQAFVAYTGWATLFVNGTIWIRYNDGTQLGINRDQTQVVYIDQEGNRHRYLRSESIPEMVKQKLERLPTVLNTLYTRPTTAPFAVASP